MESVSKPQRISIGSALDMIVKSEVDSTGLIGVSSERDLVYMGDFVVPIGDPDRLSQSITICTDLVDRDFELIVPEGVDFSDYGDNPVVLFEHGKDPNFPFPVGMSVDSTGKLFVTKSETSIEATCFFNPRLKYAVQLYYLIEMRALRAASIGVKPKQASIYKGNAGQKILVFEKSSMFEWSWCKVGVNPEAVKKSMGSTRRGQLYLDHLYEQGEAIDRVLSVGRVDGQPLLESLRKSLERDRPQIKGNERGHRTGDSEVSESTEDQVADEVTDETATETESATEAESTAETKEEVAVDTTVAATDETQTVDKSTEKETLTEEQAEAIAKTDVTKSMSTVNTPGLTMDSGEKKYGATRLESMHGLYGLIIQEMESWMSKMENGDIEEELKSQIETIRELQTVVEGLYADQFPDYEPLGDCEKSCEEMEERVKSVLSADRRSRFTLAAVGSRLKSVMASLHDKRIVSVLSRSASDIDALVARVKSYSAPESKSETVAAEQGKEAEATEATEATEQETEPAKATLSEETIAKVEEVLASVDRVTKELAELGV